jgi:hypothetical protein
MGSTLTLHPSRDALSNPEARHTTSPPKPYNTSYTLYRNAFDKETGRRFLLIRIPINNIYTC